MASSPSDGFLSPQLWAGISVFGAAISLIFVLLMIRLRRPERVSSRTDTETSPPHQRDGRMGARPIPGAFQSPRMADGTFKKVAL
ncbi:MAG: hypothetical protein A3E01_10060 [Gammaproteobacteria bacterium RIFCSPHIGHO2_12_FULL_63_22]|nr:MAG: hypothetical protein A3E01_10060 [Gammaproteobacteria bacterium RIFCSPHIGHO2_12_FULL_63_22]